tara:strand:- start:337 stop:489 length:153 start_codon:yes stop_codon:yes gene_type:complete
MSDSLGEYPKPSKEYKPHEIQPSISKEQLEENQCKWAKSFDKFLKECDNC